MEAEILAALASSDGAFTWQQACHAGVSRPVLTKLVRDGRIRKLAHDLYSIAPEPVSLSARHLELLSAAMHRYGDRIVAASYSALVAHGLPTYEADLARAHLLWRNGGSSRVSGPLQIIRSTLTFPQERVGLINAVTEPAAFLQVASRQGLLAAVVAGDAMLHRKSSSRDELAAICATFASFPGRAVAREALGMLEPLTESPGESVLRVIAARAGIAMEPQFEVYDGAQLFARADFRVRGTRLLVEFDGKVKYGRDRPDRRGEPLWEEKQREDRLRRLRFGVERVVWSDFHTPRALIARLRRASADHRDPLAG
ncbi:hypothetical protein EK0264_09155 [Epidermidibacterium keratini]|uniref:DUF559 domain-containing protein n=1 Tax=Epidermidibacterium keratini TaxID=1891644 RepID=A0A7L4YNP2_9ACTN|nr:type IV toxin-antitoxin system AbiEi family antitoxin domain-containing protein [Epidermidibacterium keratini]QHC00429.1 hypothetical protein EK0264_09155 [Epidermidibacterium keratini]